MGRREVAGFLILFVVLLLVTYFGYSLYRVFFPRTDVLLSLSVAPSEAPGVSIEGRAYVAGGPAATGRVKLTVRGFFPARRVTFIEEIKEGRFSVSGSPSLASFKREDRIVIDAEAKVPVKDTVLTGQEHVFWNVGRWVVWAPLVALPGGIVLAILLSVLFTGDYTPVKNRIAISLAYITVTFSLLVPFVAPLAINRFPELKAIMINSPVGLVQVGKARNLEINQWALNIGGTLEKRTEASSDVAGGLVVPLYVLILATLGGAINMTRKVPRLQADIDAAIRVPFKDQLMAVQQALVSTLPASLRGGSVAPSASPPDQPGEASPETSQGSGQGGDRQETTEARQANINQLRGDLINQYMYLITAPFLAMVVYYLLFLVDENLATRVPIVVLISFSAGLMSESVLRTITGYADTYLARLTHTLQAQKEKLSTEQDETKDSGSGSGGKGKQ
jgi:hypothetical protein